MRFLTRVPAFRGESELEILHKVVVDEPTSPRRLRPDVPADLQAICLKCLEKDPRARYPSCAVLAADLERFCADLPTQARPLRPVQRLANGRAAVPLWPCCSPSVPYPRRRSSPARHLRLVAGPGPGRQRTTATRGR